MAEKPRDGHVSPREEDPEGEGYHVPSLYTGVSHPLESQRDVGVAVIAANVVHSLARKGVSNGERGQRIDSNFSGRGVPKEVLDDNIQCY